MAGPSSANQLASIKANHNSCHLLFGLCCLRFSACAVYFLACMCCLLFGLCCLLFGLHVLFTLLLVLFTFWPACAVYFLPVLFTFLACVFQLSLCPTIPPWSHLPSLPPFLLTHLPPPISPKYTAPNDIPVLESQNSQ